MLLLLHVQLWLNDFLYVDLVVIFML